MRKGPWTEQEDMQLVCTARLLGDRRWDSIAQVSGLRGCGTTTGRVRLALSRLAGWPANSRNHYSRHVRTVFSSHNNQPEQYF